jgi:hypothetical protein
MIEHDPLAALLREWKSPDPPSALDERVVDAYRRATIRPQLPRWQRFWEARVSVPMPLLLAALAALALLFWFRSPSLSVSSPEAAGVVTRLNATGFEPLSNGEARVVPVREMRQ